MKKVLYIFPLAFLSLCLSFALFSCSDEVSYSTDPSLQLSFSQDTVAFDTVFTTIGSSTKILKVFNPNKEALNIINLRLANARESGFRVNVDGHHGTDFSDVEIRKKDSLYIFVEVKVNPQNRDNPILVRDSLVFQLSNGLTQRVILQAYGQDVIILRGKILESDTVFTPQRPVLIYDSLKVTSGRQLTLLSGTRLYFHDKAELLVEGKLRAEGTLEAPVLFRGDRTDRMFDNLPYDRVPGQWGGIKFASESYDNKLNYTDIHGGNYGILCDTSSLDRIKLTIENSVIHNVKKDALSLLFCVASVQNSQITNAGRHCIYILGGTSDFVHCTVANHYSWDVRKGKALYFTNVSDSVAFPLYSASFRNCLITGSGEDDLQGVHIEDTIQNPFKYSFTDCVINSKDEGLPNFVNVRWEKKEERNKNFLYLGKTDYDYDFRLDSASVAIGFGSLQTALEVPYDRMGRSRLLDGMPDVGCYEWVSGDQKKE